MKNEAEQLVEEVDLHLRNEILPYWMTRMIDTKNGGFYGRIDGNDQIHQKAPKGSVLNARILWTFSAAFRQYGENQYKEMAERAYHFCVSRFINNNQNGVYWLIDYQGRPIETKNQIYALAFMIYGLSEYFQATFDQSALAICRLLFESIEEYSFDELKNGYYEAFDQNWMLLEDLRLSEKDANEKKTMNTHLHILEAYTNLYRIWSDPYLEKQLKNLIRIFRDIILDQNTSHFKLFFDENWHGGNDNISFGHDVEGSWLMQEAAEVSGDTLLISETRQLAKKIVEAVIDNGIDQDGGMFYEQLPNGTLDTDKHWWPQAEAMVGFVNAYQITFQKRYLHLAVRSWKFIKEHIIDSKGGEWYFKVNRKGNPYNNEDKAGIWKCPYHNSRACLEILKRLG